MTERRQARSRWAAWAALVAGALVLLTPLNERLSRPFVDVQLRLLAPSRPASGVLVIDIDDASLAALQPQFGAWPYRRDVHALIIETLRGLGARAIAFDLLLVDARPGDETLARALARPGAPVMLAAAGLRHAGDSRQPTRGRPNSAPAAAAAASAPAYAWPTIALPTPSIWPQPEQMPPVGVITTPVDVDGVLRRLPLWHEAEGRRWPLLPLALLALVEPASAARPQPLDSQGALLLALAAPAAAPMVLPLTALLGPPRDAAAEAALRQRVQGQVVFIGSSALLGDAVMTVQGQASGTQVLAQTYAALRDGAWTQPPAAWVHALFAAVALLPVLWTARRRRVVPRRDIGAALLALGLLVALSALALLQWRMPTLWAAPLAVLAAGLGVALWLHSRQQAAAQRRLAHDLAVTAEASQAKARFLANVSHEIRTPLNALLGVAELLGDGPLTPTQRRQVQLFQDAGKTLHLLINDLLDLSKIEAQRFDLESAPFSLHELLRQTVALMEAQAQRKGLALRLELAPTLPDGVRGDRLRVERALSNLVGNALKFTAQGEVCVRARRDEGQADAVLIEVADTGIGIAPSKLELIFEPFSQADDSVTRLYGGTGLGLALTRNVARLMGGSIDVRSTPGQGSVFTLRLPLPAAELPAPAPPPAAAGQVMHALAGRRSLRVLLAEDNEVNTYVFCAMLADQGLQIETAPNGLAALEMLRSSDWDIAFIDVQMPGLDGLAVTRELRVWEAQQSRPRLPVVSLTANAFASDVQASLDAGSDRHLAKPFSKAQLFDTMLQLLPQGAVDADAAGAQRADAQLATAPAPHAATFDPLTARLRLGLDAAQYQRVAGHAAVFLAGWMQDFERADAEGDSTRAAQLVQDLADVAARLGADALAAAAGALRAGGDAAAGAKGVAAGPQRQAVRDALAAVVVALTRPNAPAAGTP